MKKELIVEIRFPFCSGRCGFCKKGALSRDKNRIAAYWAALRKEVENSAEELKQYRVSAVHLGYGMPLESNMDELADLLLFLRNTLPTDEQTQWSMRVMPYQLSAAALTVLRNAGINHLIMETMTCRSDEFAKLHRPYYFAAFDGAVSLLKMSRRESVYQEILLGIPGQSVKSLNESLDYVLKTQPAGITLQYYDAEQAVCPEVQALLEAARAKLSAAGMQSDGNGLEYALPGKELHFHTAKCDRMGFGAGALTQMEGMRYHNTTNLFLYMAHSDDLQMIACPEL